MKAEHSIRLTAEGDYGVFVQEADYFTDGESHWLRIAAGYGNPDCDKWYELDAEPQSWPEDDGDIWADPYTDQSEVFGSTSDLEDLFGVGGTEAKQPENVEWA